MADDQRAPQWGDDAAGVTKQELLSTVIAVFLIGTLFGWAVFGQPRLIERAIDSGSLAEWFAAFGAWVIGIAAWRYQRASFQTERRNELRVARTTLNSAIWKSQKAARIRDPFEVLYGFDQASQNLGALSETLEITTKMLGMIQWTDNERSYLDDSAMAALVAVEHRIVTVIDIYGHAKTAVDAGPATDPIDQDLRVELQKLERIGNELADRAEIFSKMAKELRNALKADL